MVAFEFGRPLAGSVQPSAELDRIQRLPRRTWSPDRAEAAAEALTQAFRVPGSTARLFPIQAVSLIEFGLHRGAVAMLPVGKGKTLLSLLAPRMVACKRPVILLPAHLIDKTEAEAREYRRDWTLPLYQLQSYQTLARVSQHGWLEAYQPDCVIADEAHYLKNKGAAVTKKVMRYLDDHPEVPFLPMTGTPLGRSIEDVAHLAGRALGPLSPFPRVWKDLDEWARALDVDVPDNRRLAPGVLSHLGGPLVEPRHAFRERLISTPGIITSADPELAPPIVVTSHTLDLDQAQAEAFALLREKWETPDGQLAEDGPSVWRHARELSTGFFSTWDPAAPDHWRIARRAWAAECRRVLAENRRQLDSVEAVVNHILAHPDHYPDAARLYAEWIAVEPDYTPSPRPVWISDRTIDWIGAFVRKASGPVILWTDRPVVGERLRERFGWPYYGEQGIDTRTGARSKDHDPARLGSMVVSRRANDSGLNLQAFSRNLVIDVPTTGKDWQQLIGRTHRTGQTADRVTVDVLFGSIEDVEAFWKAHGRGQFASEITGQTEKLLSANLDGVIDTEAARGFEGAQWQKTK